MSADFWNKVSSYPGPPSSSTRKIIQLTASHLSKEQHVLDVGCGNGIITNTLASKVGSIHGMDLSRGMIEMARRHANNNGIDNVTYHQSTVLDQEMKHQEYDVILIFNLLQYLEDTPSAIHRLSQQLKPDGLLISSSAYLKEKINVWSIVINILTRTRIIPKMQFLKVADLVGILEMEGLTIISNQKISQLPECHIVARKPRF